MTPSAPQLLVRAIRGLPLVEPGDDLVELLLAGVGRAGCELADGDVLALAQKIVSKAEGRYVDLRSIEPSPAARRLALEVDKDPRLVEVILSESNEVVRYRQGVLVVEHRSGVVLANAGIDQSNIEHAEEGDRVLLLPLDCDASAERIRAEIERRLSVSVAVLINDSLGRAWRNGTVGVALGAAGLPALRDLRGQEDLFGRPLRVTEVGFADELAAAASLLMGQAGESIPAVLIRGADLHGPRRGAAALVRSKDIDLFR